MGKHRKPTPEAGPGNGGRILLTIEGMRVATVLSVVVAACVLIAGILTLAVAGLGGSVDHPAGSASPEPGRVAAATTGSPTQRSGSGSTSSTPGQPLVPPRTVATGQPTSGAGPSSPAPEAPTSPPGASPSPTSSPTTPPARGHPTPPGRTRSKSPHP